MASIHIEFSVAAKPEFVWAAFRDTGAIHTKLARGFVTDCKPDGPDARILTFANGFVARELIVDVGDANRRLAYAVSGSPRMNHHHASFQVFAEGEGSRVTWIADLLPYDAAETIRAMMEQGAIAMRKTLEDAA